MTRRSPVTTYPSAVELRRASERRESPAGLILACVVVVGFYALGALLIPAPKPPSAPPAATLTAGAGGGLPPQCSEGAFDPTWHWPQTIKIPTQGIGRMMLGDGTTIDTPEPVSEAGRAQREAIEHHPCPGCEP